jgi:uncharacterized Fe-S cluster-containing radical SAM superfamily protein
MKVLRKKVYEVTLCYNIEADDATKAIDECLGKHPLKPISINCQPVELEYDDD